MSLVGGILFVLGGLAVAVIGAYVGLNGIPGAAARAIFGGVGLAMLKFGFEMMGVLGMFFGAVVILAAIMLVRNPPKHATWGSLIILFSVFSIFAGAMGFGLGLILSLIGGTLALIWGPEK